MVGGLKDDILKRKVDPCTKCGKRVMANLVLCSKCWKWVHGRWIFFERCAEAMKGTVKLAEE